MAAIAAKVGTRAFSQNVFNTNCGDRVTRLIFLCKLRLSIVVEPSSEGNYQHPERLTIHPKVFDPFVKGVAFAGPSSEPLLYIYQFKLDLPRKRFVTISAVRSADLSSTQIISRFG